MFRSALTRLFCQALASAKEPLSLRAAWSPRASRNTRYGAARRPSSSKNAPDITMNKIAFVSTMEGVLWGGSEELWSQAALRFLELGVTVGANVIRYAEIPKQIENLKASGCLVTRRSQSQLPLQKLMRKLRGEQSFKWLDKFKPDFVIVSQGSNFDGVPWMLECKRRNIPYAVIAQMAAEFDWPAQDIAGPAGEAYTSAKRACFVSQGNLELTQKQISMRLENAEVVRNPFNVSYNVSVSWPENNIPLKLACIGRLIAHAKGQDLLIDVLSMKKWQDRPLHVTFFGSGPNRVTLENRIKMLGLQNLSFGGFVSDIKEIWADHHGLVLPSRYEGLPLVVVEAMLCKRMCIVTDVPGNAELVQDNLDGFVAIAANARCLDEAMERAWLQRHKWEDMGNLAAKNVREAVPRDPIKYFIDRLIPYLPFQLSS